VLLVADDLCMKALLVQMADAVVPLVEALRVDPVEAVHPRGNVVERCPHDEMEVVVEQAVGVHAPATAKRGAGEELQPAVSVGVVDNDRHPRDSANGEVVDPSGRQHRPRHARHRETVRPKRPLWGLGDDVVTDISRGQSPRYDLSGLVRFGRTAGHR
jgi:hypothetical protein